MERYDGADELGRSTYTSPPETSPRRRRRPLHLGSVLLLVDADRARRELLRSLASRRGFAVCDADGLPEALTLLREVAPALVVATPGSLSDREIGVLEVLSAEAGRLAPSPRPTLWAIGVGEFSSRLLALEAGVDRILDADPEMRSFDDALASLERHGRRAEALVASLP